MKKSYLPKICQIIHYITYFISKLSQKDDLKIALIGPGGCGKSALATRILARRFITEYCPVLEDVYTKDINIAGVQVLYILIDHHQQE